MAVIKQRFDNSMAEFKTLKTKNEATIQKQVSTLSIPYVLKTFAEFVEN
jgi:hypothetical protein